MWTLTSQHILLRMRKMSSSGQKCYIIFGPVILEVQPPLSL